MNKQIIIITAILSILAFSGGFYWATRDCWKNSTKSDSPTEHRIKCKGD